MEARNNQKNGDEPKNRFHTYLTDDDRVLVFDVDYKKSAPCYGFPTQDQKNICLSLFGMFLYVAMHDFDVFGCVMGRFIVLILKDKDIIVPMAR